MLHPREMVEDNNLEQGLSSVSGVSDLEQLRKLLLGSEYEDLLRLQQEFSDHSHISEKISHVISEAIAIRSKRDDSISNALVPSVEDAIRVSAKRDPKRLSNALFPVMGPAIRESVAETVSAMMQQVNQLLENSLSARSIKWRFDAFRTKRTFAEVMLSETLVYQVEQVFLIHRESSLLINHLTSVNAIVKDPDMVSSMLTVVTDFVKDSFVVDRQQNVKSIKFGQLNLLFEAGPYAIVVAAVRGIIPSDLQIAMREQLEELHRLYGSSLETYDGNAEQFPDTYQQLDRCLLSKKKEGESISGDDKSIPWPAIIVMSLLLLVPIAWWLYSYIEENKWNKVVTNLQSEPGIVVLNHHKEDGEYIVNGLLDPLAKNPDEIIANDQKFAGKVQLNMESYYSNEASFVNKRLLAVLQPPATVTTNYKNGSLQIKGEAKENWIANLPNKLPYIWGITSVDTSELRPIEDLQILINQLVGSIETVVIEFAPNSTELSSNDLPLVENLAEKIMSLTKHMHNSERDFKVGVLGFADLSGSTSVNNLISEGRARNIHQQLVGNGISEENLLAKGLGTFVQRENLEKFSRCVTQRCVIFEVYDN
ncbi:MAG: OmpA family protein [Pseudomonadota bacterium]